MTRWTARPSPPEPLPTVPDDYRARLVGLRARLGLTQAQLAVRLGAASKAVVYQWEAQKRKPSPLFWLRVQDLEAAASEATPRR
jgi:DNA-binding XRE family transcriptional regulator